MDVLDPGCVSCGLVMRTLPLLAQVSPQPAYVRDGHGTAPFPPELASWTTSLGAEDALLQKKPKQNKKLRASYKNCSVMCGH